MSFYTQTLEDIPKEFMKHHKSGDPNPLPVPNNAAKTEDLMFILALLLFLLDEPYFNAFD